MLIDKTSVKKFLSSNRKVRIKAIQIAAERHIKLIDDTTAKGSQRAKFFIGHLG